MAANFVFLNKLQGMGLYLGGDRGDDRSINAEDIVRIVAERDAVGLTRLSQPLFLFGYGVEDPADGIHGDEEYLYVVELPRPDPIEPVAAGDWHVKVSEIYLGWHSRREYAFRTGHRPESGSSDSSLPPHRWKGIR